jgi:carboxypeptidase Taq
MTAYQQLEGRFRRLSNLEETTNFLNWDTATMMPEGGAESRAEQLATLRVLCHETLADPALGGLIEAAEQAGGLGLWQRANLREMRRMRAHATAVDARLVEALSRATSACEMAWREARPKADFAAVQPSLEKVLTLVRRVAEAKAAALGCPLYDALLDQYEPGGRSVEIDRLFDDLARFLPGFLERVLERQAGRPAPLEPRGPFPIARQRDLAERFMKIVGFEFRHGRLDVSLHPFCGGTPDDVRITTRYSEGDFTKGLMGVLHETGHALYDRGLPIEWRGQPVGRDRGMSIHESQSLLIEMQACRGRAFLDFAAPLMREAFGGDGPAWEADNLYRLYTRVTRSLIRVDADEVSYPAHVILRYRLERAMIQGDLKVADLPGAWNEGMRKLLGVVPPDDRRGCLQDIHWYDGAWGYFPTYTLGAMTAAQLFDAARRADADIVPGMRRGDFGPLRDWLRTQIHSRASLLGTAELLVAATGRPLDPQIYKRHLESRYLEPAEAPRASTAAVGAA